MDKSTARMDRKLAAIFAADVAGYSRLISQNEVGTLRTLTAHRELMDALIAEHGGRIANTAGDSVLAEFPSVVDAIECAIAVQEKLGAANAGTVENEALRFRIGVHVGDVVVRGGDLLGDGVNVAARVQALADPGGVSLSGKAYDEIEGKIDRAFQDRGEQQVKNIARPVRVYTLRPSDPKSALPLGRDSSKSARPVVIIKPFTTSGHDSEEDMVASGIVDDLLANLSKSRSLTVTLQNELQSEAGNRNHLEGSVSRSGDRVRVYVRLRETGSGRQIWAERYTRTLGDIFELQEGLAAEIGAALEQHELSGALLNRDSEGLSGLISSAYRAIYEGTRESFYRAKALGDEIMRSDPEEAKGHQVFASALYHLMLLGHEPRTDASCEIALRAAQRAVQLNRSDEHCLWTLGIVLGMLFGRYEQSISTLEQAIKVNPNFWVTYGSLGTVLAYAGRPDEAIKSAQTAIQLSPRDAGLFYRHAVLAFSYFQKGEYEQSRHWAERVVSAKPDWWLGYVLLGASFALLGDILSATGCTSEISRLLGSTSFNALPLPAMRDKEALGRLKAGLLQAGFSE